MVEIIPIYCIKKNKKKQRRMRGHITSNALVNSANSIADHNSSKKTKTTNCSFKKALQLIPPHTTRTNLQQPPAKSFNFKRVKRNAYEPCVISVPPPGH